MRIGGALLALLVAALAAVGPAAAAETVLYSFCAASACSDGLNPYARLIMDAAGNLYGTTYYGGQNHSGVVFELTPNQSRTAWTETVLHSFCTEAHCADGANPYGGVIIDPAGNLYGAAETGGKQNHGLVYKLSPAGKGWTEEVLFDFDYVDGAYPMSSLLMDAAGNLYGTTNKGGFTPEYCALHYSAPSCFGVVFMLSPGKQGWKETVLYRFHNTDGGYSEAGLVMDKAGNLYGTTPFGGPRGFGGHGVLFRLSPSANGWTESTLVDFKFANGSQPFDAPIIDRAGNLYATTADGGDPGYGTVFKLSPTASGWTETILHDFDSADGMSVFSGLTTDAAGNLYGTAIYGGQDNNGVVFVLSRGAKGWTETVLHSFAFADGTQPYGGVIIDASGSLYGTAERGGASDAGVVFQVSPP